MIRVIWNGFPNDLLCDLLFHFCDCCTNMCLADVHEFTCCRCLMFDAAIALLFLLLFATLVHPRCFARFMFYVHNACDTLSAELLAVLVCMFARLFEFGLVFACFL